MEIPAHYLDQTIKCISCQQSFTAYPLDQASVQWAAKQQQATSRRSQHSPPPLPAPNQHNDQTQYWLEREGNVRGPYSFSILILMWSRKELRLTDRLCKHGTETWTEVARIAESFERAERSHPEGQGANPPSFGLVFVLTILFPIVGIVAGIIWLTKPQYRGAGGAILAIAVVVAGLYYSLFFR